MKYLQVIILLCFLVFSCKIKTSNNNDKAEVSVPVTGMDDNLKIYDDFSAMESRFSTSSDSVYVVNFWATWCKPCVAELPYFMQTAEHYKNEKVKFLYVSLDFKKQIDSKLKPFLEAGKLKGEVLVITDPNSNEWIDEVSEEWQGSIPATLIFNKNKRVFFEQSFHYDELKAEVDKYLR